MSKDKNVKTQELLGELLTNREIDRLGEGFHENVVDHDPAPDAPAGIAGIKQFWSTFFTAFPDAALEVETLVADEDQVTAVFTITGTNTGPFQGNEPTGKSFKVRGIQVGRFDEEGLLVERWGSTDEAGMLQQIGA